MPMEKPYKRGNQSVLIYYHYNYYLAANFVKFISSPEGQKILREHGKAEYGSALYNDAKYAKKQEK